MLAGPADETRVVDRLDRAGPGAPHAEGGLAARLEVPGRHEVGRVGRGRPPHGGLERLPAILADQGRDGDRPHPVKDAVEVEHEEDQADQEEEPGDGHTDVRHGSAPDVTQELEGERQRPDQDGEHRLQHPVPVPEAHVAGRERARRHLHDEDRHGHDESDQGGGRADDRREHGARRRRGVLPVGGDVDALGEDDPEAAQESSQHRAEQRHDPEASPQVLAGTEAGAPGHLE